MAGTVLKARYAKIKSIWKSLSIIFYSPGFLYKLKVIYFWLHVIEEGWIYYLAKVDWIFCTAVIILSIMWTVSIISIIISVIDVCFIGRYRAYLGVIY